MKKRVLSALLVLCMACSMVSTVWATDPGETALPTPAPVTGQEEQGEQGEKVEINTPPADGENDSAPTLAPDAEPTPAPGGEEGENEGTGAPTPTPAQQPESTESTEEPTAAPSPEPTPAPSPEPELNSVQSVQPNQAPAANRAPAAPAADEGISTYAAGDTSRIYWDNYLDVTVYCVDEDGAVISLGEIIPQEKSLTNNNTLTFADWAVGSYETDTDVYTYKEARLDNAGGSVVTSLCASHQSGSFTEREKYNYDFYNGNNRQQRLTYEQGWWEGTKATQTANLYLIYTRTEKEAEQEGDLYIEESVADNGRFTARFQDTVSIPDGAVITYTWQRSLNGTSDWTTVERIAVSGSEGNYIYNMAEDGVYVDVVQDASPNAANVQDDQRYWYKVTTTVTTADGEQITYKAAPVQVPYYIELQNGSFETPVGHKQYEMGAEGLVWKTTGPGSLQNKPGQDIEIIRPSENDQTVQNYGVPVASQGEQFAELNCEAVGTLYQDVMTIPGTTLNWQFDHVARQRRGQDDAWDDPDIWDEMAMVIMPAKNADYWANELKNAGSDASKIRGVLQQIEDKVDGAYVLDNVRDQPYYSSNKTLSVRGWSHYDSEHNGKPYTVPEGQYLTRFFFVSVSSGMGSISLGNCLDNVYFSKDALPLENTESRVTVTKNITGLDAIPQNYSVTFQVGDSKQILTADRFTQQGQTFTASVTFDYTELSPNSSQKLTVTETGGNVENYRQAISYQVTGGETTLTGETATTQQFDLPAGQSRSVTFTNTYTPTTTDLTITKTFVGLDEETANQVWGSIGFTTGDNTATKNSDSVTSGGDGTFTATATISGLTIGQAYTITETGAMVDSYTLKTTATGVEGEQEVTEGTPPHASIDALIAGATVNFTNTYTRQTGTLVLNKDIAGLPTLTEDDQEKVNALIYNFIITGPADAVDVVAVDNDGDDNDIVFVANGDGGATATVPVAVGTNVRIENLPTGPYTVTEVLPSAEAPNSNYEILDGKYYFDETVADNGNSWSGNLTKKGATATITNTYAPYYTVTVTKQVGGAMGSSEETFTFTSEQINSSNANNITIADGSKASLTESGFTMKAGGSLTVNKVKNSTHFSIVEVKAEGYVTTVTIDGANNTAGTDAPTTAYFTVGEEDVTVTYQNDRAAVAPTGLESNHTTPYVLMITAAGMAGLALIGGIVARRVRRRRQE